MKRTTTTMKTLYNRIALILLGILANNQLGFILAQSVENDTTLENFVMVRPLGSVKYFDVPTSHEHVLSWMDVKKGIFPNVTDIEEPLNIGDPLTIFIYLKDHSNSYDIQVNDCWAFDNDEIALSNHTIHLTKEGNTTSSKTIDKWNKHKLQPGEGITTFLYTQLNAFKFPDNENLFITCDVELCYKKCSSNTTTTETNDNKAT